jgi:hypothetical protein
MCRYIGCVNFQKDYSGKENINLKTVASYDIDIIPCHQQERNDISKTLETTNEEVGTQDVYL